jgi:hypothetical protein
MTASILALRELIVLSVYAPRLVTIPMLSLLF